VHTNKGTYTTESLILCTGAWMPNIVNKTNNILSVTRQVLYWFDVADNIADFTPDVLPVFIWELQGNKQAIYGFPAIDGKNGGIKIATEQHSICTTADELDTTISNAEIEKMYEELVQPYFKNIQPNCIQSAACMYTETPDVDFIIDYHPKYSNVIIASPCSGHGFKHSAAVGQVLSQLSLEGTTEFDISSFSLSRFL
jgi:sarcosine oxidase